MERERATAERRRRRSIAAGAAIAGAVLIGPGAADAATFTVDTLADSPPDGCNNGADDECTLREAAEAAASSAGDDVITFASGLSGDIPLEAQIQISGSGEGQDVSIEGPGADQITVSGEDASRVFFVSGFTEADAQVSISGLTLANGSAAAGSAIGSYATAKYRVGVPIPPSYNPGADVTLSDVVVTDNNSYDGAGAVYSTGIATIKYGVGDYASAPYESGNVTVTTSTLTGNSAGDGGSGGAVAIRNSDGTSSITDSTISDNQASYGGGVSFYSAEGADDGFEITNSTISGNEASGANATGGGVYLYGAVTSAIDNSTIADNTATTFGGGMTTLNGLGQEPVISSSIVGDNDAMYAPDLGAAREPNAIDHSLIESYDGNPGASNIIGQDPQLGPLADNGGATQTHLPALSSPAIDTGVANGLTTDQRGLARTVDLSAPPNGSGDGTDIGSVENAGTDCALGTLLALTGTDGPDTLTGTDDEEAISGLGADDTLSGLGGDDCVSGDAGNDLADGGAGNDTIDGGEGDDSLTGADGVDQITTGPGNDTAGGGAGNDSLTGADGDDTLTGAADNDQVTGDAGNDNVGGGRGNDSVSGGDGKDKVKGRGADDAISGDAGNDFVRGGGGKDKVRGNAGNDRLKGGTGKDKIKGSDGKDSIDSIDNEVDKVNCGGGDDKARVDAIDKVSANCEVVEVRGG